MNHFFVTWQSSHLDEFSWGIFGRAYDGATGDPLTTEEQVNTFAEQPQTLPAVSSNSLGQTVTLWLGLNEDHVPAVHAQRYQLPTTTMDKEFSEVGTELVLATFVELEDASAAAAVDRDRNFVVVWQSYGEDGSGLSILARLFDANGNPKGAAFVVNETMVGNQRTPDVAMDLDGNFVVVWESNDGDGNGIFARRIAANGTMGAEFQVNGVDDVGSQTQPSISMNVATGEFVVVWQGPDGGVDEGQGIFGQRFDASGGKVGSQFPVNTFTETDQVSPAVSMNTAGQFAVVWVSDHRVLFDEENDAEKSIFVRWYDTDGSPIDEEEQLVHSIIKEFPAQEYPDVALDADGNFVVVWQSITQDGSAWGVYGRQFIINEAADPSVQPVQPAEFQINQTTAESQRRATVVSDPEGNFTVSWQSDRQDQSATAIISRQYNADGTPETDEMVVNTWELGPQILPVMAMTPDGDYGIFWTGQGTSRTEGIHGRIYEECFFPPPPHLEISPLDGQFVVGEAAGLEQSDPAVAVIETTGNYVAVWTSFEQAEGDESGLGIYAQIFNPDGTPADEAQGAFLVNTIDTGNSTVYTDDDQTNPAVAVDDEGNFVIVWQSLNQDGDGYGIYARRYAADGTPDNLGPFKVNEFTTGDQEDPTVAMDNDGNFVIAWQSFGQDGDGYGIYARRYDSNGVAIDTEGFRVNTTPDGNQTAPTVARAGVASTFVIGWQTEVLGDEGEVDVEILATLYNADKSTIRSDFPVNGTPEHEQVNPHAAMNPDGDFVFAWTTEGLQGSGADVFARQFNAMGTEQGDDIPVNKTTPRGQENPTVAIDEHGNFIVSWQSSHQDGFSWGIFARVYNASGNVVVDEFQVNTNTQGPQINPAVSANSDGTAVVVWLGLDATHHPAVHAQRFQLPDPENTTDPNFSVGPEGEVVLSNYVSLEEPPAAAAVDGNGNYIVTWQSYLEDGSGLGIYARRFLVDSEGQPLADSPPPFLVNTTTLGNQSHPDVAADEEGNFVIVWQSADQDGYGIFAQRYDSNGDPIGGEIQVNTTFIGHQGVPSVAMDPDDGSFVVVWQGPDGVDQGLGIFGQRFDPTGTPVDGEFQINEFTALDQVSAAVSMNASGEFVVSWVSDHRAVFDPDDTEKSIFVQWFDQSGNAIEDEEVLVHEIFPEFEAQENPDVVIDPDGNFIVVWQSINQDGNTWGVFARQFLVDQSGMADPAIQPVQDEFQINQTVLAPQRHASVVSDANGNFVVAWQSHAQDTSGPGVYARLYDNAAVAQTDEFLIPTWDQGPQTWPVMALAENGNLGIFWTGHGTDRAEGVHGRIFEIQEKPHFYAASVAPGQPAHVVVADALTGEQLFLLEPFPGFTGGVHVALGDVNFDGVTDIITAAGPGGGPHVRVFDGTTGEQLPGPIGSFMAYDSGQPGEPGIFTGGVYVAVADLNCDGHADIITGAGAGGGPHVKAFSGQDGSLLFSFMAYDAQPGQTFTGGVRVAAGDVTGDGVPDIITGAGPGGGPHVRVFDGSTPVTHGGEATTIPGAIGSYMAYHSGQPGEPGIFTGGIFVSAGEFDGLPGLDIVTAPDAGGGPHIRIASAAGFTGNNFLASFMAYDASYQGGVSVATIDWNNDGNPDVLTGQLQGTNAEMRVFDGTDNLLVFQPSPLDSSTPLSDLSPPLEGGMYVAGTMSTHLGLGSPLLAAQSLSTPIEEGVSLTEDQLTRFAQAILARSEWSGLSALQQQTLASARITVRDLPGDLLGLTRPGQIILDQDAAGYGWFIDPTPGLDEEFAANDPAVASRMDLMTVLSHEFAHLLGAEDGDGDPNSLMAPTLEAGTRRNLDSNLLDELFAGSDLTEALLAG